MKLKLLECWYNKLPLTLEYDLYYNGFEKIKQDTLYRRLRLLIDRYTKRD